MSSKLADPFSCIAFAIGMVLQSQKPISISSENELLLQTENLILQNLPLVQELRESLLNHQGTNMSREVKDMIHTFRNIRRFVFPFRIHLSELANDSLLDMLRFSLFVFSNKNHDLCTLFELYQNDIEDVYMLVNDAIMSYDKSDDKYIFLLKRREEEESRLCKPLCVATLSLEKPKAKKARKIVQKVQTTEEKKEELLKKQIKLLSFLNKKRK